MLEKATNAAMAEVKRQLDGQQIPGDVLDPADWSATGNSINMELVARAVIEALMEQTPEMLRTIGNVRTHIDGDQFIYIDEYKAEEIYRAILQSILQPRGGIDGRG